MNATTKWIIFVLLVVGVIATSIQILKTNEKKVYKDLWYSTHDVQQETSIISYTHDGGTAVTATVVTGDKSISPTDDSILESSNEDDDDSVSSLDDVALESNANDDDDGNDICTRGRMMTRA